METHEVNTSGQPVAAEATDAAVEHTGSSVRTYLAVGLVLAISTVIEVQLPQWLAGSTVVLVAALLVSAFFKAGLVALFYMHLKGDSRIYSGIMVLAMVLVVYFAVLLTWGQFAL